jgi:hypothetical protein
MDKKWWISYPFTENSYKKFIIGPFSLWFETRINRALIAYDIAKDALADQVEIIDNPDEYITHKENLFRSTWNDYQEISLKPRIADRSIIANFDIPFKLPSNERVSIYISSPVWIDLYTDNNLILSTPSYSPSDTWFGPSNELGELAYSTKVNCRFSLDDVPFRPHRVVTKVEIFNKSSHAVTLLNLRLPTSYLSIFESKQNRLFTEKINYTFQNKEPKIQINFNKTPEIDLKGLKKITPAKLEFDKKFFKKTFQYFFKQGDNHGSGPIDYDI